jgi:hypothetical protein
MFRQGDGLVLLQALEELEKEARQLSVERENLLDIENRMWVMVREDIRYKIRKNQELRMEIEQEKKKCVRLASGLNAAVLKDCSREVC